MKISENWTNAERFAIVKQLTTGAMFLSQMNIDIDRLPVFTMRTMAFIVLEDKEKLEAMRRHIEQIINNDIPKMIAWVESTQSIGIDSNNASRETNEYFILTHSALMPFLTWVPIV